MDENNNNANDLSNISFSAEARNDNNTNDLSNIDLSDETINDNNNNDNGIILFECRADDASQSIFDILALPELD